MSTNEVDDDGDKLTFRVNLFQLKQFVAFYYSLLCVEDFRPGNFTDLRAILIEMHKVRMRLK